jgi:hypothetical protein
MPHKNDELCAITVFRRAWALMNIENMRKEIKVLTPGFKA